MLGQKRAKLRRRMIADTEKFLNLRLNQPADRFQPILRSRQKGLDAFDKRRAANAPGQRRGRGSQPGR